MSLRDRQSGLVALFALLLFSNLHRLFFGFCERCTAKRRLANGLGDDIDAAEHYHADADPHQDAHGLVRRALSRYGLELHTVLLELLAPLSGLLLVVDEL